MENNYKSLLKEFQERDYVSHIQEKGVINISSYCLIDYNYRFLLDILPKNSRILEIGPGNGFFVDWLLINGYINIALVDLDRNNVKYLKEKYKNLKSVKIYESDAVNFLKNCSESFDVIITRQLVEHLFLEEIFNFFRYSKNCLSENGLLINETINSCNLVYGNYFRYDDFSHYISFTPKSYIQFSYPYFSTTFLNYKIPSTITLLKYYFSKDVRNKINKLSKLLFYKNKKSVNIYNSNNSFKEKLKMLINYHENYVAWKKSLKFSKKYLPNEKIVSHFFIAISKVKH